VAARYGALLRQLRALTQEQQEVPAEAGV